MQDIQPELIEKYQMLLERDPRSQVFAPLCEAYRKMGMLEEAFRVAVRGVQFNPNFAGGRIALARALIDRENIEGAVEELTKAVELSADNILAHTLLGECHLTLKNPKEALRSFKMVVFLTPNNEKALRAVKKLEALTADEFDEELFQMKRLPELHEETPRLQPMATGQVGSEKIKSLERYVSLIDAYIVRNDMDKAWETAQEAEIYHSGHKELAKRIKLIQQRSEDNSSAEPQVKPPSRRQQAQDQKIQFLQSLLGRIQAHSRFTDSI